MWNDGDGDCVFWKMVVITGECQCVFVEAGGVLDNNGDC